VQYLQATYENPGLVYRLRKYEENHTLLPVTYKIDHMQLGIHNDLCDVLYDITTHPARYLDVSTR
jgi:hypothetical protein